jgi:excisionase family DNA binding protein
METNDTARNTGAENQPRTSAAAMDHQDRRVWSVEEVADLLGISRAHAYELVARKEIPHLRLGRRIVVPKHVLEELLSLTSQ